jgi:y4mF family transcriptional regulator
MAKSGKAPAPTMARDSSPGAFGEVKPSGKGSRLVRYPTAFNAMRALLNETDAQAATVTVTAKPGRIISLGEKPSPPERSKPSPAAVRLVKALGLGTDPSPAAPGPSDRPLPRIEPARILEGADLGDMVRIRRHMLKLSQKDLAGRAGVGRRFVGELEAGKPTAELGKTLAACRALGLTLTVQVSDGG